MDTSSDLPSAELLEDWDRRYYLHEHVAPEEYRFVHVVEAEGMHFTLGDGTRILDFASQTVCCNLGHRHPRVVSAVKEALDRYGHLTAYPRLGNHYKPKLAKPSSRTCSGETAGPAAFASCRAGARPSTRRCSSPASSRSGRS